MNKRRVTYAKLHDLSANIPGFGNLNMTTLPPRDKTFKSFNMFRTDGGDLEIEINGVVGSIPSANIQYCSYASDE